MALIKGMVFLFVGELKPLLEEICHRGKYTVVGSLRRIPRRDTFDNADILVAPKIGLGDFVERLKDFGLVREPSHDTKYFTSFSYRGLILHFHICRDLVNWFPMVFFRSSHKTYLERMIAFYHSHGISPQDTYGNFNNFSTIWEKPVPYDVFQGQETPGNDNPGRLKTEFEVAVRLLIPYLPPQQRTNHYNFEGGLQTRGIGHIKSFLLSIQYDRDKQIELF